MEKEIGSGGGGIVYLGKHLRLNKRIILKADKRSLSSSEDKLRREVDLLKNLSHTYIPQVYDFVQENGIVYTVMDYIEGESMDKILERKQIPPQPQIVKWACQLLEALEYLHKQPPHGILHGDIKPANIMVRPNGDVCLIDYNIALALGEEGAVKVGFSRGYASPEHYGMEYITRNKAATGSFFRTTHRKTGAGTEIREDSKEILLDVRSDIYSLGATLYHMLSGIRPVQDARDIVPLGSEFCSKAVSAILQKAMAPQPYDRYQTAEEMLADFQMLPVRDRRAVKHRRRMMASAVSLTGLFLAGGIGTFIGLKQLESRQTALTLAEYSANALAEGDISTAVSQALLAIPSSRNVLEAPVTAQAQKALTDALGVYDLSEGFKNIGIVNLPGAPFDMVMSPQGTRVAIVYAYEVAVYDLENGHWLAALHAQESALSDCVFIDEDHIVYAGEDGVTCYDLDADQVLWVGETATTLAMSADRGRVAAVNRDEDYVDLYDVKTGSKLTTRSFDGQHLTVAANDIFADSGSDILALNEDGSLLAVSFSNGGLMVLDLNDPQEDLIIYEESEYRNFSGGFCGKYFAFAANKNSESQFSFIDVYKAAYIGGYKAADEMIVQMGEQGIYLSSGNRLVYIDPDKKEEMEIAYTEDAGIINFSTEEQYTLVATEDNAFSFYDSGTNRMSTEYCQNNCKFVRLAGDYAVVGNRNEPAVRVLKLDGHREAQLLAYDARYVHEEARVSQDGNTVMLFQNTGFRIYDKDGNLLKEMELPDAAQIYDQQFRKGETDSWLEVIWYDGTVRCYSAADGTMISEETKEPPQKDLYEEFVTEKYIIKSSLHGAPEVYGKKSNQLIGMLPENDYLSYVTQVDEYIITEYVSVEGDRYGRLLDSQLQELAELPGLCDIADGMLIFDYKSGNLRQCRLYSLQELIALGESYINNQ